jgi:VIT1/CCC1 family predicted Fe2+/Mn2+ transporter
MNPTTSSAESLDGELTAAYLYRVIAQTENEPRRRRLFEELARDAESQAEHWRAALAAEGAAPAEFKPALRARLVAALVRLLGARRLTQALTAMKVRGMSVYRDSGTVLTPRHAGALPSEHDEVGEKHQGGAAAGGSGSLRAAVFGVNDGLVSNASLILGVAGAVTDSATVLLAGVAGLLAGAFSMAAGEYVSMRSQREMYEYQIALEKAELEVYPEEEAEELALIFEARGMAADEARQTARQLIADPERALETLTREELGLNPGELGSPWGAAVSSFIAFAVGGAIPLAPYLVDRGPHALAASIALSGTALFAVGASISLFTGRSALAGGLRMLGIGAAAGAVTYAIGSAIGIELS